MTEYVLGIDGGGTRTRVAIVTLAGDSVGYGTGGPSNYHDIGMEAAQANIAVTIAAAWSSAGHPVRPFAAAYLGMAGMMSASDRQIIYQIATNLALAPDPFITVHHDCRIALAGALAGRPGIILITGTGSSCYGINTAGQDWLAGGWGHLLADEGSSYWFGLNAMRAAVNAADGRGPHTLLLDRVTDTLGLASIKDIMHRLYGIGLSRPEIAALAPLVIDAGIAGDAVAAALIREGIDRLVDHIQAAATRLDILGAFELAMVGGLQNAEEAFAAPLRAAVTTRLPGCTIHQPELSPVFGACLLAIEHYAQPVPADRAARLRATYQVHLSE